MSMIVTFDVITVVRYKHKILYTCFC